MGGGGYGGDDLRPPSPVICKSLKVRSSETTLAIRVQFLVYSSSSS